MNKKINTHKLLNIIISILVLLMVITNIIRIIDNRIIYNKYNEIYIDQVDIIEKLEALEN